MMAKITRNRLFLRFANVRPSFTLFHFENRNNQERIARFFFVDITNVNLKLGRNILYVKICSLDVY